MWDTLINFENDRFGLKTIFHCIIGVIILVVTNLCASLLSNVLSHIVKIHFIAAGIQCFLEIFLFLFLLFFYIKKGLKQQVQWFRINYTKPLSIFFLLAFILPGCIIGFYYFFVAGDFFFDTTRLYEKIIFAIRIGLTAGICEEILFRGYIMKLIEARWNKNIAIFAPSILFAALHLFGVTGITDVIQLFIAGITVGIMFSSITYACDTVNNSIIIHGIWNFLIIGVFNIAKEINYNSLSSYIIHTNEKWLTGGSFGIESGVPAIIGYISMILVALLITQRTRKVSQPFST